MSRPSNSIAHALRSILSGFLMGLANLVPGISGGTMLLITGIYPRFISAIADASTFRLRPRSAILLVTLFGTAILTVLFLAGTVSDLVRSARWCAYSLFIGLSLGGIPIVWRLARPGSNSLIWGILIGLVCMIFTATAPIALLTTETAGPLRHFVAGLASAGAMILPGISGGYLLLLLGEYLPILSAIDALKDGLKALPDDFSLEPLLPPMATLFPLGMGLAFGAFAMSNLMRTALKRHGQLTYGLLLGLLLGSLIGLWPFQVAIEPAVGDIIFGQVMDAARIQEIGPDKWPTKYFWPTNVQIAISIVLILIGTASTLLISRLSGQPDS